MRVCEKEDGFGLVGVKDGEWLMSLYGLVRFLASYALRLITVQLRDERRSGTDDSTFIEEGINLRYDDIHQHLVQISVRLHYQ